MQLGFLREHIEQSNIEDKDKERIINALDTHNWQIGDYNAYRQVVYLEADNGYWLNNIPINLFPRETLIEEIIKLNKTIKQNLKQ